MADVQAAAADPTKSKRGNGVSPVLVSSIVLFVASAGMLAGAYAYATGLLGAKPAASPEAAAPVASTPAKPPVAGLSYDFATGDTHNWTASNASLAGTPEGLIFTATAADSKLTRAGLKLDGTTARYIVAEVTRRAISPDAKWEGRAYYATANHAYNAGYFAALPKDAALPAAVGDRVTLIWDMHNLAAGGADWKTSTIERIRLDFDNGLDGTFIIHSIKVLDQLH